MQRVKIQDSKIFGFALTALLLALNLDVEAQQQKKIPRMGYFTLTSGPSDRDEAFKHGLHELGWVDGQNIMIEYRWVAGKTEQLALLQMNWSGSGGRDLRHFCASDTGSKECNEHNSDRHAGGFTSCGVWVYRESCPARR